MDAYDVIVIGAGSTGENIAGRAAGHGLRVAIVEEELVGGECSYYACIPSKALLRPAAALCDARTVAGAREAVTGSVDADAVLSRRDMFASNWDDAPQASWLQEHAVDLVRGCARITGMRVVTVEREGEVRTLTADHAVVICTGSDAAVPDVPGMREARTWTSRDATGAHAVPESLIVVGGGPVGCELATAWQALGSAVTLAIRDELPLEDMEPRAGEIVRDALRARGVRVETGATLERVERHADGSIVATFAGGRVRTTRELLCATGRRPRTDDLGLDLFGLEPGKWIEVDDRMQVAAVPDGWLYAAGDVTHRALLTHMGKYDARICGDVIAARVNETPVPSAAPGMRAVPQVVFTDPEVAAVGLTEARARTEGLDVVVIDHELDVSGARLYADDYVGAARLVVDAERSVVLGATFVGRGVGELLHSATIAIVGEIPLAQLVHAVPSFPTISEIWLRLLEKAGY
jgi:dihydrolipoamide dehydrogenase